MSRAPRLDLSDRVLGVSAGELPLPDCAAIRDTGLLMATQAARELRIFSRDLDAALYDHQDFLAAVRRLSLTRRDYPVRVLAFEAQTAVRRGHRLIELARQLTSKIAIRRVPADFEPRTEAYLLADDRGYVLRQLADVWEGTADFCDPLKVRLLGAEFDRVWEASDTHPELRRLFL